MMKKYDIVIVGAGPAGSTAARFAAKNKAKVLVLERDREPGLPVRCAEGVSINGIQEFVEINPKWVSKKITNTAFVAPSQQKFEVSSMGEGITLERRIFDTDLCRLACIEGAEFLYKANVVNVSKTDENDDVVVDYTLAGKPKQVKANIVIAADGIESKIPRLFGINSTAKPDDIHVCAQYTLANTNHEPSTVGFYFGQNVAPGGYAWLFPKADNTANVGLGISHSYSKNKKAIEYLDDFVTKSFPNSKKLSVVFGAVNGCRPLKKLSANNFMVVGDSARQANPLTGGGIETGMFAGQQAGIVAAKAIKANNFTAKFLKEYDDIWNKRYKTRMAFMEGIRKKYLNAPDKEFNKIINALNKQKNENFSKKDLFKIIVKNHPKLLLDLTKVFISSKLR